MIESGNVMKKDPWWYWILTKMAGTVTWVDIMHYCRWMWGKVRAGYQGATCQIVTAGRQLEVGLQAEKEASLSSSCNEDCSPLQLLVADLPAIIWTQCNITSGKGPILKNGTPLQA